jgi:putative ATPase
MDSMSLFARQEAEALEQAKPLAARMRPRSLDEIVGQEALLRPGSLLRRLVATGRLGSVLFHGPPGTGKTTLARVLAAELKATLFPLNAVTSGVKELREVLQKARDEVLAGAPPPLVFVDEIHRFNRSQQDALLPDVEEGIVSLIGATTSNPFFSVNAALLSRSQVLQLEPLAPEAIRQVIDRALSDRQRGLGEIPVDPQPKALDHLATAVDGDARRALMTLDLLVRSSPTRPVPITIEAVREALHRKVLAFDASGDEHYDLASALIKSIRGSDVDASLYWLARFLESGEEIRFLCRRLLILASEDIGNADPQALILATSAATTCEWIGLPECQLTLSQTVIYLAMAPKSNSATTAIAQARRAVREEPTLPVPKSLRDAHYAGAEKLGHGTGYQYAHDFPDGVAPQDYLGAEREFYQPTDRGLEGTWQARLDSLRNLFQKARKDRK